MVRGQPHCFSSAKNPYEFTPLLPLPPFSGYEVMRVNSSVDDVERTHLVDFGIDETPEVSLFGPVLPIYGVDHHRWSSTRT